MRIISLFLIILYFILTTQTCPFWFDVQILLDSFNVSQNRNANNKREIIRQLNKLPIHNQYELHLKNGKIRMVDKLTPLLIGKTKIMHFYEKL